MMTNIQEPLLMSKRAEKSLLTRQHKETLWSIAAKYGLPKKFIKIMKDL